MRATVVIDPESEEPVVVSEGELDVPVADYEIVSEWSLLLAVAALQHVYSASACQSSRLVAEAALKRIGETGDLEVDQSGKPLPVDTRKLRQPTGLASPWTAPAHPSDA